ncbi:MAG: MBL fold metallo-hydrolase [Chloroflexi bacterium]|jgi:competence protein ComEC|nr:MBL fold metallo-hydrolase [Chloroflexota bacterium]MBT7080677.1 MBL fold metallo-hydrolase [Chloroflexota bacterium]MBT7289596.1 MBL fold metallo-hydrolase [Chloroflexota bacterium]
MKKFAQWLGFPLVVLLVVLISSASAVSDNKLHVHFLDVGQGDAVLIRTPSRQTILIDGGTSPELLNLELGRRLPFWDHTIDLIILTHPHDDHLAGLVDVLRRYDVKRVVQPDVEYTSSTHGEWQRLISEKAIKTTYASAGGQIDLSGNIYLEVINPQANYIEETSSDIDNNAMVLRLVYNDISFLFTADIGTQAERKLIDNGWELNSEVLKVAHHGSNTSISDKFIRVISPDVAVISVGADNKFGHPSNDVLDRLSDTQVFRTDINGTIEFITDGSRLWQKSEKQ